MSSTGGYPFADVTGRMAAFGRLFGEQVGVQEASIIRTPEELVGIVRTRLPRIHDANDDLPVFEAAAYVGEWIRARSQALWVAEGPFEPHLQVLDSTHAIVYLVPMVSVLRTASTAGYDGLSDLLDEILEDTATPARPSPLSEIRVEPEEDREAVIAWVHTHRNLYKALRASLWRRCGSCAQMRDDTVTMHHVGEDWETESASAAAILARRPFVCPCGGFPGQVTRFLMLRATPHDRLLGDIYVTGTFTRVGCWRLRGRDQLEPFDALALASDELF